MPDDKDDMSENERGLYSEEAVKPAPIGEDMLEESPAEDKPPAEDLLEEEDEPPPLDFESESSNTL